MKSKFSVAKLLALTKKAKVHRAGGKLRPETKRYLKKIDAIQERTSKSKLILGQVVIAPPL